MARPPRNTVAHQEADTTTAQAILTIGGQTADDVADLFRHYGVKGQPKVAGACPLARYYSKHLGLRNPAVARHVVTWTASVSYSDEPIAFRDPWTKQPAHPRTEIRYYAKLPTHLSDFVKKFDAGYYADLIG